MEKLVTIVQQFPLTERNYTDRSGQAQVFASKGFVLSDGIDTFYAEMVGDTARAHRDMHFDESVSHAVQTQISTREYTDRDNQKRYSNDVRILKMV